MGADSKSDVGCGPNVSSNLTLSDRVGAVAQLVRALACHARGHEFKSRPFRIDILIKKARQAAKKARLTKTALKKIVKESRFSGQCDAQK